MQNLIAQHSKSNEVPFEEVKNPESAVFRCCESTAGSVENHDIPQSNKKMIINLFQMKKRCEEEKVLLLEEVQRLDVYYRAQKSSLHNCMLSLTDDTSLSIGLKCLLKTNTYLLERESLKLHALFKKHPEVLNLLTSADDQASDDICEEDLEQVANDFLDNYSEETLDDFEDL